MSINLKVTTSGSEALTSADVMSYDPDMLEFVSGTDASGGAGSVRVKIGVESSDAKSLSATLTFKALSAGTGKITVSSQEVYDANSQLVTIDQLGNSTVTVTALEGAAKDATLSELKISPGVLTPEFSPEVDTYTAEVGLDVDKITVSAPTTDENARVSITGNEGLQPGENQIVCQVTAQDGTTVKTYTINVSKVEGGASDGGSESTGESVSGVDVVTVAKTVTIIPVEEGVEIPKGLTECNIKIDGQDVQGWVWASETDHEYCVFYGMNEAGEKGFYRYDLKEKTMQRYFQDPLASSDVSMDKYVTVAEDYNALLKDYQI
ncbi:MAG: cadherin-like beta sandwich domain-containing protein, partial [Hungatella sp.]